MNTTLLRAISGSVFVASIILPILFSPFLASVIFSIYAIIGLYEFNKLTHTYNLSKLQTGLIYLIAISILTCEILNQQLKTTIPLEAITLPALVIWLIIALFETTQNAIETNAVKLFGILYAIGPIYLLIKLNVQIENKLDLIGIFVLIWANDTFAYLIGSLIGKTKLFERISPKKTWEGTIGGILCTLLIGAVWKLNFSNLPLIFWIICAFLMAISAIFGDLFESQLKRQFNVKDSGNIIPGHGGVLDRFDASLFGFTLFYGLWSIYH